MTVASDAAGEFASDAVRDFVLDFAVRGICVEFRAGVKSPSMSRWPPENFGISGDAVMSRFSESQPNPTGAAHGLARF